MEQRNSVRFVYLSACDAEKQNSHTNSCACNCSTKWLERSLV